MEVYPHLDNGIYDIVDLVMRPLALKQTRRPRSDRGKAHHSVSSSSSHHHGTPSHQHDGDDDVETSHASTLSPSTPIIAHPIPWNFLEAHECRGSHSKVKTLENFYVINMEKDPATPLLVGRGFLATASVVIDCKKAKIAVGEGITRSIFGVKEINLGDKEVPYWTIFRKRESYEPQPSTYCIGARPPYYAKKYFMDYHLLGEGEIARDAELNLFKDVLVFRKMVIFDKEKPESS
ncbi:hypothetical protein Tco_1241430 [Tanacetum coccineum]